MKKTLKKIKNDNGITLIALVITIIVLLILAGVTVVTLTGDNGLLTKAGEARNTNIEAEGLERIQLAVIASHDNRGINTALLAKNLSEINGLTDINNQAITEKTEISLPIVLILSNSKYKIKENGNVTLNPILDILDGITTSYSYNKYITAGLESHATISTDNNVLTLSYIGGGRSCIAFSDVDLTHIDTLYLSYKTASNGIYQQTGRFYVGDTATASSPSNNYTSFADTTSFTTISLDVSSITGLKNVMIGFEGKGNPSYPCQVVVEKIWGECK